MSKFDDALFRTLNPFMTEHGFTYNNTRKSFYRVRDFGFDEFNWHHFSIGNRAMAMWLKPRYEGGYGLGQRHDSIAALTAPLGLIHGDDNTRFASTFYRDVTRFPFKPLRDKPIKVVMKNLDSHVKKLSGRIQNMLQIDGLNWFDTYADLTNAARDLNNTVHSDVAYKLCNNPDLLPLVGVSAACEVQREKMDKIIDDYLAYSTREDLLLASKRPAKTDKLRSQLQTIVKAAQI